jgi:hypothetical protein
VLPWLAKQPGQRPVAVETGAMRTQGGSFPTESISADFISRAIGGEASREGLGRDNDLSAGPRKIIVHPPGNYAGMMSLGRGLPQAGEGEAVEGEVRRDCGTFSFFFFTGC